MLKSGRGGCLGLGVEEFRSLEEVLNVEKWMS